MFFTKASQYLMLLLRIATGWVIAYDGLSKFTSSTWSFVSVIKGSHIAPQFYNQLALEPYLSVLSQFYPIALIIAGLMILTGLWIRIGGGLAIVLLVLSYLPGVDFPLSANLINTQVIHALVIGVLLAVHADNFWGLGADVRINK
jgi:uncharacterized membrane protein YphA (DoxX/SURF4 family)